MLTAVEIKILERIFRICCKFMTIPLTWKEGKLSVQSNHHRIGNYLIWLLLLAVLSFKSVQFFRTAGTGNINGSILQGLFVMVLIGSVVYKLNVWMYKAELVRLINQTLHTNSTWGPLYLQCDFIKFKLRERAFLFMVVSVAMFVFLACSVAIVTRNKPYSMYRLIRKDDFDIACVAAFAAFVLVEAVITVDFAANGLVNASILYFSCLTIQFWLQKTCVEWPMSKLSTNAPLINRWILQYKGIYILSKDVNVAFGKIIFPFMKLLLISAFVICFFAVIHLHETLDAVSLTLVTVLAWTSIILLVPISSIMSSFYDLSSSLQLNLLPWIQQISDPGYKGGLEKSLRSCPLVRCQVGSLYHMEAKAKLTMYDRAVNGVAWLLVNAQS